MIRFACIYCGKHVTAEDAWAGKLGKCPACFHIVRVPRKLVSPSANAAGGGRDKKAALAQQWSHVSNREIADTLLADRSGAEGAAAEGAAKVMRWAAEPFLPKYDDLTLFVLSAALLLLLLIHHHDAAEWVQKLNTEGIGKRGSRGLGNVVILIGFAGVGMVASFFGVFFKRDKPEGLKGLMLWFAVFITSATGIYAACIALQTSQGWWTMIFPAWNIIDGVILLVLFRFGLVGPDCVTDEHASLWQVLLSMACIALIMAVCHFGFRLHATVTYSICVCYTMTLNQLVARLLVKHRNPDMQDGVTAG
jgi:hypothetical protein